MDGPCNTQGRVNTPFWLEKYNGKVLFGDTTIDRVIGIVK